MTNNTKATSNKDEGSTGEERTFTPDEVNKIVQERLARERKNHDVELSEIRSELISVQKELKDKDAKLEGATEAINDAKRLKFENVVYKVAIDEKIAPEVVFSLRGDTEDELKAAIKTTKETLLGDMASNRDWRENTNDSKNGECEVRAEASKKDSLSSIGVPQETLDKYFND